MVRDALVSLWRSPHLTDLASFACSGFFIAPCHFLTAGHVLKDGAPLWARSGASATDTYRITEAASLYPQLDVALLRVDTMPQSAGCLSPNLDRTLLPDLRLYGYFEGALEDGKETAHALNFDDPNKHYRLDIKQPKGHSGSALCIGDIVWGMAIRHYEDANIHRGCALAIHQFWEWLVGLLPDLAKFQLQPQCTTQHSQAQSLEAYSLGNGLGNLVRERRIAPYRLPGCMTGDLFGRENEITQIDSAWEDRDTRIVTVVAGGGAGKTALVTRWLSQMARKNYCDAGRVFTWSFYRQGTNDKTSSAEGFFSEALTWLGDTRPADRDPLQKGFRLAQLTRDQGALLVLDGIEPLQYTPGANGGRLKDAALKEFIKQLAAPNTPAERKCLCLLTSRESLEDIAQYAGSSVREIRLPLLSVDAGMLFLKALGVWGTQQQFRDLVHYTNGHSFTLFLFGRYLHKVFSGNIAHWRNINLSIVDTQVGDTHARHVMEAYEEWFNSNNNKRELAIIRLVSLFDRAAPDDLLSSLIMKPVISGLTESLVSISRDDWLFAISNLRECGLLLPPNADQPEILDTHPLVREYFGGQVKKFAPDAWREGHRRLYEHLKFHSKQLPESITEMEPLYAAIYHGCQAGLHVNTLHEILQPRILRWDKKPQTRFFSTNTLGLWDATLGVISMYFDRQWTSPITDFSNEDTGFICVTAGPCLRTLCRWKEAIEATSQGLRLMEGQENWDGAARAGRILSQTYLVVGDLEKARFYGSRSVDDALKADKLTSASEKLNELYSRARYAEALHYGGYFDEAEAQFLKAIALLDDKTTEGGLVLMDGYSEYEYCNLLLSLNRYNEAAARASAVLDREANASTPQPLWLGLNSVILGRVRQMEGMQGNDRKSLIIAETHMDEGVKQLEMAGEQQHKPRGYFRRAGLRSFLGKHDAALSDIQKAWDIAHTYKMPIFEVECHMAYSHYYLMLGQGFIENALIHWESAHILAMKLRYGRCSEELNLLREEILSVRHKALKQKYDLITADFINNGIDLSGFYNNPSYYGIDANQQLVLHRGNHPTIVHWPISDYEGGPELLKEISRYKIDLSKAIVQGSVAWVEDAHLHCTVYSPVHSSDPSSVAAIPEDIEDSVRESFIGTECYTLRFTRIIITHDGAILVVGYPSDMQLDLLRTKLATHIPKGEASSLVHITIGRILRDLGSDAVKRLAAFVAAFGEDVRTIGQIDVAFITFGMYTGPVTHMTMREIFRHSLIRNEDSAAVA